MKTRLTLLTMSVALLSGAADFRIDAYGAKPDGSKCTAAFAAAFEKAEAQGGGRIVVPKGKYLTGSIRFKTNCTLHLEEGAEIVFTQDPQDFLPAVFTSWEGMECWNFCPCIYAYECDNVAITGSGTIRGFEGEHKDTIWKEWVKQTLPPNPNATFFARRQLYMWGETDFPTEDRQIWKVAEPRTRPHLIQFNRCKNVRLEGVKVRQSPFWTIHLYLCSDVTVRGIDVKANGNNNDGIDLEMTRNVLIENCRFDQGDDAIVLKSGRNRDAWRLATPTENVVVRNCEVVAGHTLLGIGSELSGGIRNVRLENCVGRDIWRVIFIKTNHRRGGFVENILVDGLKLDLARESLVEVNTATLYEWAYFPEMETRLTPIRNVCVRNVKCREAGCVLKIDGDARLPVENIKVESIKVEKIHRAEVVKCAKNVTFDGKVMEGLHAEESVTVPGIVTLDTPVGHAEIALKGARVLGWSPTGDREMLRMMYKTYADEPGEWSHGGICPCWPWFGGKDVNGKKVIHGFIREKRFELRHREATAERASVTLGYRLKAGEEPTFPYAADLEVTLTLTSGKLEYVMKTTNVGKEPFAYSEGIHPYFHVGSLPLTSIEGVEEKPFKVVEGMDKAFDYQGGLVRILDRCTWNRAFRIRGEGGSHLVVWTPGTVEPPNRNLSADDMLYFACVGPFVSKGAPTSLKPGESHVLSMVTELEPLP